MNSWIKVVAAASTAAIVSLKWFQERHFRQKVSDFKANRQPRHLSQRVNNAFLYLHKETDLSKRFIEEHNRFYDKFQQSQLDDHIYNTPIACVAFRQEALFHLKEKDQNEFKYAIVGKKYNGVFHSQGVVRNLRDVGHLNISEEDVYFLPEQFPSFNRGRYVSELKDGFFFNPEKPVCEVSEDQDKEWCERALTDLPILEAQLKEVKTFRSKKEPFLKEMFLKYPLSYCWYRFSLLFEVSD
jgi:hypothetical protein